MALVELQYRGVMWLHVNGKEWTPYAFPGFQTRGSRARCGQRPGDARRTGRRTSDAHGRINFPAAGPASRFGVFQRIGGAGRDRACCCAG